MPRGRLANVLARASGKEPQWLTAANLLSLGGLLALAVYHGGLSIALAFAGLIGWGFTMMLALVDRLGEIPPERRPTPGQRAFLETSVVASLAIFVVALFVGGFLDDRAALLAALPLPLVSGCVAGVLMARGARPGA